MEAPASVPDDHLAVRPEPDPGAGQLLGHLARLAQPGLGGEGSAGPRPGELPRHASPEGGRPVVPFAIYLHVEAGGARGLPRGPPPPPATPPRIITPPPTCHRLAAPHLCFS